MKPVSPGDPAAGAQGPRYRVMIEQGNRIVRGPISVPALIAQFSAALDRPLIDETGLRGEYEVDITFAGLTRTKPNSDTAQDNSSTASGVAGAARSNSGSPTFLASASQLSDGPSLARAAEKQLGLHIEATRTQVEMLVIDHVDRAPTDN